MKREAHIREGLGFDDILIVPRETSVKPADVSLKTQLTRHISMNLPIVSAGLMHVTESAMAIAMARAGGIGIIHGKMPMGRQVEEVRKVKRAQSRVVSNPITISPESSVTEAMDLMITYKVSGLPVIDNARKVVGIITHRDVRFFEEFASPVSSLMNTNVITVKEGTGTETAKQIMHDNKIEKLVVVDHDNKCVGLMTLRDLSYIEQAPDATIDEEGRLCVAASVGLGKDGIDRAGAMGDAGLDIVVIDAANGQSKEAAETVSHIRQHRATNIQIIAGNVATPDSARRLIDAGADSIKVGLGGNDLSPSRTRLGIGMPQVAALIAVYEECSLAGIPMLIDNASSCPATIAKALALGASAAILGCVIAGAEEAPGRVSFSDGKAFKTMSPYPETLPALQDPYKLGMHPGGGAPYLGSISRLMEHMSEELKMSLAYAGCNTMQALHEQAELIKV